MNETGYLIIMLLPLSVILLFAVVYHLRGSDKHAESELEKAAGDNEVAAGRIEELERVSREAEAAAADFEGRFGSHADRIREADIFAGAAEQANRRIEGHCSEAEDLFGQSLAILEEIKNPK